MSKKQPLSPYAALSTEFRKRGNQALAKSQQDNSYQEGYGAACHDFADRLDELNGQNVPVSAIHLTTDSERRVVRAEVGGQWVTVIEEYGDSISHIVEWGGMDNAIAQAEKRPKRLRAWEVPAM